jgi:hypothetical protein
MTDERRQALLFYFALPALIGFVLGANQAGFGGRLPWGASVAYWVSATLMAWLVFHLGTLLAAVILRPWEVSLPVKLAVGLAIASLPARILLNAYAQVVFAPYMAAGEAIRTLPRPALDPDFLIAYAKTWSGPYALWLSANLFFDRVVGYNRYRLAPRYAADPPRAPAELEVPEPVSASPPRPVPDLAQLAVSPLLSALPLGLGYDIIALKSEDHYLRVFTERGDALILYRLASAIEELEGLGFDGLRVHRSHWVRRDSVTAGGHEGRQPWVVLTNGLKVPVSQTYREIARLAGLPI